MHNDDDCLLFSSSTLLRGQLTFTDGQLSLGSKEEE